VEQSGSINFLQGRNRYRDRYRYRTISSDPWRGGVFLRAVAPVPVNRASLAILISIVDLTGTAHHHKGQDMQVLRAGYAGFTGRICRFYGQDMQVLRAGYAGFTGRIQKFRRLNAIQGRFEFDIACRGALFQ
jgi:hypothetical protein